MFADLLLGANTVHIDDAGAMSDEAIGRRKDIVYTDAKTNLLDYLHFVLNQTGIFKLLVGTILCWRILHSSCPRCFRR